MVGLTGNGGTVQCLIRQKWEKMKFRLDSNLQNLVKQPSLQEDSPTKKTAKSIRYNLDVSPDSKWILVDSTLKARSSLLYIQEAGEFFARSGYFTKRQSVHSYLIKIVLDGEGLLKYEGKQYLCPAGSFFWIDCRKPHYYSTAPGAQNWHMVWLHFLGAPAKSYYTSFLETTNGSPVGSLNTPPGLPNLSGI